ncbi:MAG: DUF262 domain-containing protein [Bullifex sp.]|nr:DUF262 domain-containing protein [Bullifex sp.]
MGKFSTTTITKAIHSIATNKYLLPAIQRKFVWSTDQIEMLFDSIMRGYPINAFMLWLITDTTIKHNYKFYSFISNYCQHFGEENPDAPTPALLEDFYAVVDGQQRLTSLYIGLIGSYRYKKPNKWWVDTEENLPTRRLFLNIQSPLSSENDNSMEYEFSFLSADDLERDRDNVDKQWFLVGDILKFTSFPDIVSYIAANNLTSNQFAMETLSLLWNKIHTEELINYCTIDNQDQDKVLEIFIRANSGGTQLSFSDLLMSISSANWTNHDARKEIKDTKDKIFLFGNPNFFVSQDFILKSILVLASEDIRFKLENFSRERVSHFENEWDRIKKSLICTFRLLGSLGYSNTLLRAQNAAIPIAYYIYKNDIADTILRPASLRDEKEKILKWLNLSQIKGIFGGHSDEVLKKIRAIIAAEPTQKFPLDRIISEFASNPTKNYAMDDAFIDSLLCEQWGTPTCSLLLQILYPDTVLNHGVAVAQDHMHPRIVFTDTERFAAENVPDAEKDFFLDPSNYNSILNLQLLSSSENSSKGDTKLADWKQTTQRDNTDLYVEANTSLDFKDFHEFIDSRRKKIKEKLLRMV